MKPTRKVATHAFTPVAKATAKAPSDAKPVRDSATEADASKSEYRRKAAGVNLTAKPKHDATK